MLTAALYVLAGLLAVGVYLSVSYRRWREETERERFLLGLRELSVPELLSREDRLRLALLRSPGWAVWRWLPELWRRPSPPRQPPRPR